MRRSNVDQLRRGSSSNFADHRYYLELSTSSIASFEPGSIVPRSSSIPQAPASSIYVLSLDFPRFFLVSPRRWIFRAFLLLRRVAEFPALFLCLRHFGGFPELSVDLRRVAGFPALFISLRYVAG